jgi:DNA transformation protein
MPPQSNFVDYILELLEPLGEVRARAMFGGWGIYQARRMFALVANEMLYLKTDSLTRPAFETRGLPPFTYEKGGKVYAMAYFQPPAEALDNGVELRTWAAKAIDASARASVQRRKPKPKRKAT